VGCLTGGRGRFNPATGDHTELLKCFLGAAQNGDVTALAELPAEDAIAYNDGGGKVRAALRPIVGRAAVPAFVAGLMSRYPLEEARLTEANGEPAIWTVIGGQRQLVTFGIRDGRIHEIFGILNPDKLSGVDPASTA
jgi:RNA polymerase sigma-70 factor (ECF subfamily)